MLKKWFIEKCCFTDYCTVQLYKIVLKAWKQSALEHLQHPVLRQPRTWESRVGEAALLSCPGWSWQLEEVSQLTQDLRPAGINRRGAPWQHKRRLPPLESVSPGLGASGSTEEELHFCAFSRWEGRSSQLCFHTGALAIPQTLFIKQAALDVTAGSSVTASDWGDPFCLKCWILTAREPVSAGSHTLSNLSVFTALLDQSKNHWIPQVLLSCFHLAICLQLGLSQTYKGTVKAKTN